MPVILSSYRFPTLHPEFPWSQFRMFCDQDMPQVYWEEAHNPGDQLERCASEFLALSPQLPLFPTGAAWRDWHDWEPTPAEVTEFMDTARALGLAGCNFWEWADCRARLPQVWQTISDYPWDNPPPPPPPPPPVPEIGIALEVIVEKLRVRSLPNTSAPIIDYILEGDQVTGINLAGSEVWVRIAARDGHPEGWAAFYYGGQQLMRKVDD